MPFLQQEIKKNILQQGVEAKRILYKQTSVLKQPSVDNCVETGLIFL